MTCVPVCVCFTPRSIFQTGSCGRVYIIACPTFLFACGPPGINFKFCVMECNRCSPGGSLGHNHDVYLSFQNKETNNQTVEQGALVAEEEVKFSSHLSALISL